MHRVTWKTYGDNENYREFSEYAAAKRFFWFLQKQSWATHAELRVGEQMQYQTTINIALDTSSLVITYDAMMPTEAESVSAALADFTASGYAAEELLSIETRAYEDP